MAEKIPIAIAAYRFRLNWRDDVFIPFLSPYSWFSQDIQYSVSPKSPARSFRI